MDSQLFFTAGWEMRSNTNSSGENAILGDIYWVNTASTANLLFLPPLNESGLYHVFVTYASLPGSATNAPIRIVGDGPRIDVTVDQTASLAAGEFHQLSEGPFAFDSSQLQSVAFGTAGADGLVSVDAVKLVFAEC